MRKAVILFLSLAIITSVYSQEYEIDDFESVLDWQIEQYYGFEYGNSDFNPNSSKSINITNILNYGDELLKPLDIVKSNLIYDRIEFWFYSNNTYTDILLKIVDKGKNERCRSSITFGTQPGVWHLFNKSIVDFQDCKNKYMNSLGSISFYVNDYPSDFYAGPISIIASNFSDENITSSPGWIYIYNVEVSPSISPKGKPVSLSCDVMAENSIDNVTINILSEGFNQTSFMEKVVGNLTHSTYRYILDPQPADPDGTYFFRISAVDYGGNRTYSDLYTFEINSTLRVDFSTDKQIYNISDTMYISGTAKDVNYHDVPGNLTVKISSPGWSDIFSDGAFFGMFNTSYFLSSTPFGWTDIDLFFDDGHGNTGSSQGTIYMNDPYRMMNYTLIISSPENGTSYFEGDVINLEARVLQGPYAINDSDMSAMVGQIQAPMYYSGDSYKGNITLQQKGNISSTFLAIKDEFMGVNTTYIEVFHKPEVDPETPFIPSFPGGSVSVSLNITFPNGTPMTGLNVTGQSPTGEIPFYETDPGLYNASYNPGLGDSGDWNMTVDINGNSLETDLNISINLLNSGSILIITVITIVLLVIIILRFRGV